MTCERAVELLPWLLNGTLAASERVEVVTHLRRCASCRAELEATGRAWEVFEAHVPARALVDYAIDPAADLDPPRAEIETHLAACPDCRAEVDRVRAAELGTVLPIGNRSARPLQRPLRALALAASLVGALGVGLVIGRSQERAVPAADAVTVELRPAGRAERGPTPAAEPSLSPSAPAILFLATNDVTPFDSYGLEIRSGGAMVWRSEGATRQPSGDFVLHLPAGTLPAGEAEIHLRGRRGADWLPIERYRLRVGPPAP